MSSNEPVTHSDYLDETFYQPLNHEPEEKQTSPIHLQVFPDQKNLTRLQEHKHRALKQTKPQIATGD